MSSSEIAKLETRWQENPHGLTFAPLAEAYRKLREPQRALEVLAQGLARHPDYIPASIVLGRCHLDLGDEPQAEAAFRRVLELDDENVIALKGLADIAERDGRFDEAQGRLRDLLAVDRSNDEARAQLARVESAAAAGPAARLDELAMRPGELTEALSHEPEIFGSEPDDAIETPAEPKPELSPADYTWDHEESFSEAPAEPAGLLDDGLMLEDNLSLPAEVDPLPDLVTDDLPAISSEVVEAPPLGGLVGEDFREHSAAVTPLSDLAPGAASISGDFVDESTELAGDLELDQDVERDGEIELSPSTSSEFQIESATDEWVVQPPDIDNLGDDAFADDLVAEDAAPALGDDPVVTESMAEIYLEQGHRVEALQVYRELYERNRDDLRLRERVDELETALAAEEAGPDAEAPERAAPEPVAAPDRSRSVAAFLSGILASRPAGTPVWTAAPGSTQALSSAEEATDDSPAAPTRPASDRLSLSAVFGDAGSPVPPAVPASASGSDDEGISFDAFFGGDVSPTPSKRGASRDDDDLDQFHAWLQNLKR